MAETSLGKKFEESFKNNWKRCFPNTFLFRLKDNMNGFKETSGNPCDFLCLPSSNLYMVECKEHRGQSIPFTAIPQYERLLEFEDLPNICPGILIWFSEKDTIIWVPITEARKMVENNEKSIGLRMLEKKLYNIFVIPTEKKKVFLNADYNWLVNTIERVTNE